MNSILSGLYSGKKNYNVTQHANVFREGGIYPDYWLVEIFLLGRKEYTYRFDEKRCATFLEDWEYIG